MSYFWSSVMFTLVGAVIGAVIAFFLTKRNFEKQLRENPPINEKMIRAMMMGMGRTPSEAQVRQIMKQVNSQKK